ncbi:hypothetical protein MPER_01757 [Moniliophthora perniciosa FA553]|nr:hypothetical protein MPER_01757 [Moniliophthora perniciosa FA553]
MSGRLYAHYTPGLDAQLVTVPPYAVAFIVTVFVSWLSDKYEARSIGSAASLLVAGYWGDPCEGIARLSYRSLY